MAEISLVVIDGQRTFADALAERLSAEAGLLVMAAAESVEPVRRLLVCPRPSPSPPRWPAPAVPLRIRSG